MYHNEGTRPPKTPEEYADLTRNERVEPRITEQSCLCLAVRRAIPRVRLAAGSQPVVTLDLYEWYI